MQSWGSKQLATKLAQQKWPKQLAHANTSGPKGFSLADRTPCGLPSKLQCWSNRPSTKLTKGLKHQKNIFSFGSPNIIYFIWQSAFVIFMKLHRLLLQMGSQYQRLALKQHNLKQLVKEIEKHNIELEKYGFAQSSFTPRYIWTRASSFNKTHYWT